MNSFYKGLNVTDVHYMSHTPALSIRPGPDGEYGKHCFRKSQRSASTQDRCTKVVFQFVLNLLSFPSHPPCTPMLSTTLSEEQHHLVVGLQHYRAVVHLQLHKMQNARIDFTTPQTKWAAAAAAVSQPHTFRNTCVDWLRENRRNNLFFSPRF